jgi:hypothetical protein
MGTHLDRIMAQTAIRVADRFRAHGKGIYGGFAPGGIGGSGDHRGVEEGIAFERADPGVVQSCYLGVCA